METADSGVQTGQGTRSADEPYPGQGDGLAVCLRSPRGGMLRVVRRGSDAWTAMRTAGWTLANGIFLSPEHLCPCGCGLPVPFDSASGPGVPSLQRYADPENCRRALYALQHPMLDLSGLPPVKAMQAARMAAEAVEAAKLGQGRATVDASRPVEHVATRPPDTRPSNRLRLSERHWQMLGEIKTLGFYGDLSYSAIAEELIDRELEYRRACAREEEEHDG